MTPASEFLDQLTELFAPLGATRWRKMFGGAGLYIDDFFFAIVDDGQVYFKGDALNEPWYSSRGSEKFTYPGEGGKPMSMNYWRFTSDLLSNPSLALEWGNQGLEAARRAKSTKKRRPPL